MTNAIAPKAIPIGAPRIGQHVLEGGRIVSIDSLDGIAHVLNVQRPRNLVRVISFRTPRDKPGVCTGLALQPLLVGDTVEETGHGGCRVALVSAGCVHGISPYVIPAGSIIEDIQPR